MPTYHRRLAAIGVTVDRGVAVGDPLADAEPFTAARAGGGREALRRCKVFMGNLVLRRVVE
jgi:hypothetical protein